MSYRVYKTYLQLRRLCHTCTRGVRQYLQQADQQLGISRRWAALPISPSWKVRLEKHRYRVAVVLVLLTWYLKCLPDPLFNRSTCTVLEDRHHHLLGARIAADGQWRFPHNDSVPEKFKQAITCFEDKRFYYHPGIDPLAISRAFYLNIKNLRRTSGGSTLSMQVIRLSRNGQDRTILEKIIEMIQATRLELKYSKEEILALYAAHAPFGGNVVGLDAAAWKYYGRSARQLSWAETATLAVLPNSPSLINPGKNRDLLLQKRNRLLERLQQAGVIDSLACHLARAEPLPDKPVPLPSYAPHLLDRVQAERFRGESSGAPVHSTLDINIQHQVNQIVGRHSHHLQGNGIHNAAALVVSARSGDVLAYTGNTLSGDREHGSAVDAIVAPRSTGSILKPLLYAAMLNDGELLPAMLIPDIPSYYGGYVPKNFFAGYDGAVPAKLALSRSLNVPAVRMLNNYGIAKFHDLLRQYGLTTLNRPASHYGLTLILGGAEATLWDLGGVYAGMTRSLNTYNRYGKYPADVFRPLNYYYRKKEDKEEKKENFTEKSLLSAGAIWHTFEAMVEVARPDAEIGWRTFNPSAKVAWKTGTSFGFRDGWAIGCTPEYVVAIWTGNADGEGRPGLTGISAAAPILFDIFNFLGHSGQWFSMPVADLAKVNICKKSGHRASDICTEKVETQVPKQGLKTLPCPYHRLVHLDPAGKWQVHGDCVSPLDMVHRSYFVLPPTQELYYRNRHPDYEIPPPFRSDCIALSNPANTEMDLIYPRPSTRVLIPTNLDGSKSSVVCKASHRNLNAVIYWHLDKEYIGQTKHFHELALNPSPGEHTLTLVDENGKMIKRKFSVID